MEIQLYKHEETERAMNKIKIKGPSIRLGDLLKFSGLVSTGGEAKLVIMDGKVLVNGKVCTMRGKQIVEGDTVQLGKECLEVSV